MKKKIILMSFFLVWAVSLQAENITRKQADTIVLNYIQSEGIQLADSIYTYINETTETGITITTSSGETFNARYACWVYCFDENEPIQRRYIFIKKEDGNLLVVIASNDISELGDLWAAMGNLGDDDPNEITEYKDNVNPPYPNPVSDILTLPCNGENTVVTICDLKGALLFSGLLSGKDACQLNVSFLNTGVYIVNVNSKNYKIFKI